MVRRTEKAREDRDSRRPDRCGPDRARSGRAPDGCDELYDLVNDPGEIRNLAGVDSQKGRRLRSLLEMHLSSMPELETSRPLTAEERQKLEALGYAE